MQWLITKRYWIIFLLAVFTMGACEKVVVDASQVHTGLDYYPLSAGQYRTYEVYQINYNFATQNDTLEYEIKERIADHYLNQEGDSTFVMERLKRQPTARNWQLDSTYHIRRTPYQVVELNNNIPLVKLVFPVSEGKKWDSNLMNASPADSFKMVDVDRPFLLNDSLYKNTLTVLLRNIQDEIVRKDIKKEVYGKNIGPVYKVVQQLNYCADPHCIGQGIITSGLFQEMKLKAYGKE